MQVRLSMQSLHRLNTSNGVKISTVLKKKKPKKQTKQKTKQNKIKKKKNKQTNKQTTTNKQNKQKKKAEVVQCPFNKLMDSAHGIQ